VSDTGGGVGQKSNSWIEYDTSELDEEQSSQLKSVFTDLKIPYTWRENDLSVKRSSEGLVDGLFDALYGADDDKAPQTNQRSTRRKQRNARLKYFDRPLYRDWLAYVTLFALPSGAALTLNQYRTLDPTTGLYSFNITNGFLIDLLIAFAIQYLLFGVCPGSLRLYVRRRKQDRQTPTAVGWESWAIQSSQSTEKMSRTHKNKVPTQGNADGTDPDLLVDYDLTDLDARQLLHLVKSVEQLGINFEIDGNQMSVDKSNAQIIRGVLAAVEVK